MICVSVRLAEGGVGSAARPGVGNWPQLPPKQLLLLGAGGYDSAFYMDFRGVQPLKFYRLFGYMRVRGATYRGAYILVIALVSVTQPLTTRRGVITLIRGWVGTNLNVVAGALFQAEMIDLDHN